VSSASITPNNIRGARDGGIIQPAQVEFSSSSRPANVVISRGSGGLGDDDDDSDDDSVDDDDDDDDGKSAPSSSEGELQQQPSSRERLRQQQCHDGKGLVTQQSSSVLSVKEASSSSSSSAAAAAAAAPTPTLSDCSTFNSSAASTASLPSAHVHVSLAASNRLLMPYACILPCTQCKSVTLQLDCPQSCQEPLPHSLSPVRVSPQQPDFPIDLT
jgi:hypothetical protein